MFTTPARQRTRPRMAARNARARLRRLAGVLASLAVACWRPALTVRPRSPRRSDQGPSGSGGVTPVPVTTVRVVATGGMAGWQITLIALEPPCSPPPQPCSSTGRWPAAARPPQPPADHH